jgi:hypothetical protein
MAHHDPAHPVVHQRHGHRLARPTDASRHCADDGGAGRKPASRDAGSLPQPVHRGGRRAPAPPWDRRFCRLVEPPTQADPELKSARRYCNLSAADVVEALQKKGYTKENLPSERSMRDILKRMNYRLKRIQKGKPLKKTAQTNPIFANVKAVKQEIKGPDTLEISVDTKAKVNEGDYARGGKNPDRRGRQGCEGLGS